MNTKHTETLIFEEHEIEVKYEVSRYYPATIETPEEGGEIEIQEILYMGEDVLWLFEEIKGYEEKVIELIINKTNQTK